MTNLRIRQIARETALTVGAALGVVCLLAAVATPLLGVRLLVFQSGSMSPTVETGGVALTRTVDAADLAAGDIVSVTTSEGTRVTHRIADLTSDGDQAVLTLQGDANAAPDRETYPVTSADRVFWHANGIGYVLRLLASPYAVFIAGGAAAGLLAITFRRRAVNEADQTTTARTDGIEDYTAPSGRSRIPWKKVIGTGAALAVLAGGGLVAARAGGVTPTLAAFSDSAEVDGSFATMTVPPPQPQTSQGAAVACTNGPPFSGTVDIEWADAANPPAGYHYEVDVYRTDPTSPAVTYSVTDSKATIAFDDLTSGANATYHVVVRGVIDGIGWESTSLSRTIWAGLTSWDFNCGGTRQAPIPTTGPDTEAADAASEQHDE